MLNGVKHPPHMNELLAPVAWRPNRRMLRDGWADLKWLPRDRAGWNMTLAAWAYAMRRQLAERADLNLWAQLHGCPASARYARLGDDALVLWHGTSAPRAEKIRQVGLFPKKGIWATAEPTLAHSFARNRAGRFAAGSATVVLVFDRENIGPDFEIAREKNTLRFRRPVGPEFIEYILWDDSIEFVGAHRSRRPKAWGVGRFKRVRGRWVPRSRPPVRFDGDQTYESLAEWLDLSVRRILTTLGEATAVEVFSSLYATIDPTDALRHDEILDTLDRLCRRPRSRKQRLFSLSPPEGGGAPPSG